MKLKPRNLSGFADYTEAENTALANWIKIIEATYRRFGFTRLTPRPFELREVLLSKGGIQKQIFGISRLHNDGATDMALPFDRTVPMAYWVAKHQNEITFPYKRYDLSYSFRGERAQAGRFQGFFQADVDIIGQGELDNSAGSDTIAVIYTALQSLGFPNIYLYINEISLVNNILRTLDVPEDSLRPVCNVIDSIGKFNNEEFVAELLTAMPSWNSTKATEVRNLFLYEGSAKGFTAVLKEHTLINESIIKGLNTATETSTLLISAGIPEDRIVFRPAIVRGLDYYTGIVFETFVRDCEGLGSIASGGRYDNLASTFTDAMLPGVGGSIGLTRLFDLAVKNGMVNLRKLTEADYFVGYRSPELKSLSSQCATELRRLGLNTDAYSGTGNFKKQLSYANKKGFGMAVLIMDAGAIVIKNMNAGTQQEVATIEELSTIIQAARREYA